jgi:hypothetical protein
LYNFKVENNLLPLSQNVEASKRVTQFQLNLTEKKVDDIEKMEFVTLLTLV